MAYRGKLLSGSSGRGIPVHAASFIRRRQIVLETQLLSQPSALRLIAIHEIFHFVWARLGNLARKKYAGLLRAEIAHRARGELGESASLKKNLLKGASWRDYVCESFCDTAAWFYAGIERHREFTLARRWREPRKAWFERTFAHPHKC
jgi:hypothetical protein